MLVAIQVLKIEQDGKDTQEVNDCLEPDKCSEQKRTAIAASSAAVRTGLTPSAPVRITPSTSSVGLEAGGQSLMSSTAPSPLRVNALCSALQSQSTFVFWTESGLLPTMKIMPCVCAVNSPCALILQSLY